MATLDAGQIYQVCREAGFTPNQAVTMTAIALAESGGRTDAHAGQGEDSWGLFQVNLDAHRSWTDAEALRDPLENARAAFRISRGGQDISPWTVTHQGKGLRYASFRSDAIAAAVENGDLGAVGNFEGSAGYGHPTPAAFGAGAVAAASDDDDHLAAASFASHEAEADDDAPNVDAFLYHALGQVGDDYVFGAEAAFDDANPDAFDCSELVQWAAHQAGVDVGDLAQAQFLRLANSGGEMSVEEALRTPGALLFWFPERPTDGYLPPSGHVAISLGDGRTVEARGRDYGVGVFETDGRRFTQAAVIPGLRYHTPDELERTPDLIDRIVHGLPATGGATLLGSGLLSDAGGGFAALDDLDGDDLGPVAFDHHAHDRDGDGIADVLEAAFGHQDGAAGDPGRAFAGDVHDLYDDRWGSSIDRLLADALDPEDEPDD